MPAPVDFDQIENRVAIEQTIYNMYRKMEQ